MKTKLEMAHEYAIALINSDCEMQFDKFIRLCWNYADAMQAEADKRENNVSQGLSQEEWQPDWSQAPLQVKWWAMDANGDCYYFKDKPKMLSVTWMPTDNSNIFPTQSNYQGSWEESLRERP